MPHQLEAPILFKYRWFDESGAAAGFAGGPGRFDGISLRFGEYVLDVDSMIGLHVDNGVFFLSAIDPQGELLNLNVEVFGTDPKKLEIAINASRSDAVAAREKKGLIAAGQADSYRDAICPFCKATILLVNLPETEQVYCEYCDTLYSRERTEMGDMERHFRICESCEMYSRPRSFSVFYFYFLVFTFGFHHDTTVRCSGCMRRSAWKMVIGNLFGLIGLPFALVQLYRSYSTRKLTGVFERLDDANLLARRGRMDEALELYDQIMDRVPQNAGVKFNIASGLMFKRDYEHAEQMFELSLDDCANYWPSINGLLLSLQKQRKTKKIAVVRELWGLRPGPPPAGQTAVRNPSHTTPVQ